MIIKRLFTLPALAIALWSGAVTVSVSAPGTLSTAVSDPANVTTLSVNGPIDASDLQFIADSMRKLRTLDLSGCQIDEYQGDPLSNGSGWFAAHEISDYGLAGATVENITLPTSTVAFGEGAFAGSELTAISFPAGVDAIGMGAFAACKKLTTVTIPASVKKIGANAFADCTALTTVNIAANVTAIPASAFRNCTALNAVTLPSTVTAIDSAAFLGCTALKTIAIPTSVKTIGNDAFRNSGLESIDMVGSHLTSIGAWAFADNDALTTIALPETLEQIGEGAFFHDSALTSINLSTEMTEIPDYAFVGVNAIESPRYVLPWTVSHIGNFALKGWNNTADFSLPSDLHSMGDYAMEGWDALNELHAPTNTVPNLGESVWNGIDQSKVRLYVWPYMTQSFQDAAQWQDFSIQVETGLDAPAEADSDSNAIKAFFVGTDLIVESSVDMELVQVFATNGANLVSVSPNHTSITIDTEGWSGRIYIVRVELENGNVATLKIARR